LPYLAFRFFASDRTVRTLDELDPRVTWADRVSIPVLGWCALCGLVALGLLATLREPALPAFVVVLNGGPAVIGICVLAILLAWGGWLCYRLDRAGWILTFVAIVGLRIAGVICCFLSATMKGAPGVAGPSAAAMSDLAPDWLVPVVGTIETAVLIGFGLFVSREINQRYQISILGG
jgi:hypothetical protein